jgi:hypothetical protein
VDNQELPLSVQLISAKKKNTTNKRRKKKKGESMSHIVGDALVQFDWFLCWFFLLFSWFFAHHQQLLSN